MTFRPVQYEYDNYSPQFGENYRRMTSEERIRNEEKKKRIKEKIQLLHEQSSGTGVLFNQ